MGVKPRDKVLVERADPHPVCAHAQTDLPFSRLSDSHIWEA